MANNKEEIIFKVKAELAGFKKSMDELKKMAKESSKSIEKMMNLDLTDEGSKAGKSFAKGMNKEIKTLTDNLQKELKLMSQKTYTIKVKLDASDIERVKRELTGMEIRVSASASGRASSSMSNNANAPNGLNTMASAVNSAALGNNTAAINRSVNAIVSAERSIVSTGNAMKTTGDSVKSVGDKLIIASNSMNATGDKVQAAGNSMRRVSAQFDSTSRVLKVTTDKMDAISTNIAEPWKMLKYMSNTIKESAKMIKAAGNKFRDASRAVRDTGNKISGIGEKIKQAANKINQAASNVKVNTPSNVTINGDDIKDASNNIKDAATDIQYAATDIKDATDNMMFVSKDINNAVSDMGFTSQDIRNAASDLKDVGEDIGNLGLDNASDDIRDAGASISDAALDLRYAGVEIKDAVSAIDNAKVEVDVADKKVEVDTDAQIDVNIDIDSIVSNIKDAFKEATKSITPELTDAFKEATRSIAPELAKALKQAIKAVTPEVNKVAEQANKKAVRNKGTVDLDKAGFKAPSTTKQPQTDFSNLYAKDEADAKKRAEAMVSRNSEQIIQNSINSYKQLINSLGDVQDPFFKKIADNARLMSEALENALKGARKQIQEVEKATKQATDAVEQTKSKLNAEIETVRVKIDPKELGFLKEKKKAYEDIVKEIEKYQAKLEHAENFRTKVESKMSQVSPDSNKFAKYASMIERVNALLDKYKTKLERLNKAAGLDEMAITIDTSGMSPDPPRDLDYFKQQIDRVKKELEDVNLSAEEIKKLERLLGGLIWKYKKIGGAISDINKETKELVDNSRRINTTNKSNSNGFVNEGEDISTTEAIEKVKKHIDSLNSQKEALGSTIDELKNKYEMLQNEIEEYESLLGRLSVIQNYLGAKTIPTSMLKIDTSGFDEMAMAIEDANEAVTKLRMNLKLLSRRSDSEDSEFFGKKVGEYFVENLKNSNLNTKEKMNDAFSRAADEMTEDKKRARTKEFNYKRFDRIKHIIDKMAEGQEVSDRMLEHVINIATNMAKASVMKEKAQDDFDAASAYKRETKELLDEFSFEEFGSETYNAVREMYQQAQRLYNEALEEFVAIQKEAEQAMKESWEDFGEWFRENYPQLPSIRYNVDLPAIYDDLRKQRGLEPIEIEYIAVGPEDVVHAIEKIEEAKKRIQNIIEVDFTVIDMDEITGEMEQVKRICDSTRDAFKGIGFDETKLIAPLNVVKSSLGTLEASIQRVGEEFEFVFETVRANSRKALGNAVIEDVPYRFIDDQGQQPDDDINRGTQAFRDASGEVNSILQAILNALKRLGMVAGNVFAGIGAAILKAFDSNPIGRIRAWAASIRDSVDVEEVEQARNTLRKFINDIRKEFPKLDNLAQRVKKSFSDMFNTVKRLMNPFSLLGASVRKVTGYFRNMGNEASGASGKVDKLTGSVKGLLGKLSMFFGIYELFGWMKEGTEDAMKYEATIMNLQRTLGIASKSVIDFANTQAVAFGLSKRQVAEYGNIFSVIMNEANAAMAKAGDTMDDVAAKTANMSQKLLESAGIIASATGYNVEDVLEGLRSGILGSSEAVDQYGLNLKIANLEQSKTFKEVANGATSWNQLTTAQQQYIIAQEIINQTTAKYGGIIKNTASLHNQFLAQLANTKLALGNLGKVIWTAILPALTKLLAYLEVIFNYAASALTALLALFNIKVDFSNSAGTDALQSSLGSMEDTATDTSGALDSVGDSSEESAKKTEESAKKIKRALAGFDQINVLALGQDEEETPLDEPIDLGEVTPVDPGDFGVQLPDLTPQTQENLQKFKGFIDKIKALLKELAEPFKAAWDELGFRWIQAWNRLKESFRNFCESLGKFLKAVWDNGGKEFVQHMAEIALAVGIAAMEIGGTILNSLAKLWEHLNPENNGHTQAFLDALNEVSVKVRDLLLDLNNHFESLMLHGGQEVLNAFGDMLMDLGTAATRAFGVIIDAIDGLLDHLDPINNEITRNMLQAWEGAFKSIGDAALAFADLLESALVNGLQDVVNALGDLGMQILATMGSIVGEIADSAAELFRHLDPATNKYSAGALEGFRYFIDSIRGFVEMLGEAFSLFMENGGQEFVNNMGDIVAILIDLGATIAGDLISAITNFFNSWAGQIVIEAAARALELFSSVLKGLLEILEHFSPILSGVVAGFLAFMGIGKVVSTISTLVTIFQTAGGVIGIVKTALTALWGVMMLNPVAAVVAAVVALGVAFVALYNKCDGFREAVQGIMDAFSGLFEAIKGALSNILDDITNIFQDVIDIIVGIFTGDGERVGEAVRNLVTHILQLLGDLVLGAIDIGINLITGLIKGLWEGIKLIPEALIGIFNFIVDFFKGLFGINSPSTVFAGYGVNLIEGLAQGVSGSFDLIGDAITGIFSKMKETITKAFNGVTKFFSGLLTKVKDACTKIKNTTIPQPKAVWKEVQKKTSGVISKIKDSVKKFKVTLPDPKLTWKTVQDKANKVIKTIKSKVTGFKANLPKPKISWGDITTTVKNSIDKVKKIVTGFSWSLPKPKLPRFSVSGGEAPWGFMGKGSMPKISIKWYKTGGIMMSPTIFGAAGNSLLGGGEAGPEAILPLDQFWRQLSNQFQQQNMILRNAAMSNNSGNNRPVNITLKVNDIEMGRAVINSLHALSNHGGNIDLPI